MSLPAAFLDRPIAHRGLHAPAQGAIENSLTAVRAAAAAGYGVEIDVQLSRDGVAMVVHDSALDRLAGRADRVADLTAAELAAIRLTGGTDTILPLDDILAAAGPDAPVLIELKDATGRMQDTDGALEDAVARALDGHPGPAAVMSFNPDMVAAMAARRPDIPRGLVTCGWVPGAWDLPDAILDRLRGIPDYDRTGAAFVSHDAGDLDNPRLAELKAASAAILCWTIRTPAQEARARAVADNITFEGYRPAAAPA